MSDLQRRLAIFLHQCEACCPQQPLTEHERIDFERRAELIIGWVVEHGGYPQDVDLEPNPPMLRDTGFMTTPQLHLADAEQSKKTGGMLALIPRIEDARYYAVEGGEPVEDLHVTLYFFGSDVTALSCRELLTGLDAELEMYPTITAKLFAHAMFNPTSEEPCAVYLVSDSTLLTPLKEIVNHTVSVFGPRPLPEQHEPWLPHLTAKYDGSIEELAPPGEITFDRIVLRWGSEEYVFPLIDS